LTRRSSLLVVGLLVAAIVGVLLFAVPGSPLEKRPTLGLDLQGGLEVTLQAVPPPNRDLTKDDLERSVDIMRSRVDKLGVAEPEIRTQGNNQIVIQLPGVKDPEAAAKIIGTTAQLELYDLETSLTGPSVSVTGYPVEHTSLYELLAKVQAQAKGDTSDAWYVVNTKTEKVVSGPYGSKEQALKKSGDLGPNQKLFSVPKGMVVITCGNPDPKQAAAVVCPGGQQGSGASPRRTTTSSSISLRTSRR
jgi:preprotein translocase subunit SecD